VSTEQKIGLFGGSFNPVQLGHLLVAQAAYEELGLSRLYFIPAAQSPFKAGAEQASPEDRVKMLRLALVGRTYCEIDEQEVKRGGLSYTIDTVRDYLKRFPNAKFYWLIGADHVATLPKWREADELARLLEFVVIPRPGEPSTPLPPPFHGQALQGFPLGVSASQIRARIKAGQPIDLLVGPAVAEAIRNNRLYL
jgi:nicotinate-nucleotide adenylyltransferase